MQMDSVAQEEEVLLRWTDKRVQKVNLRVKEEHDYYRKKMMTMGQ